jgi:hypothetical protein
MEKISSLTDLVTWIENANPGSCLTGEVDMHGAAQRFASRIQNADHPAWGTDWEAWLDEHAESIVLAQ